MPSNVRPPPMSPILTTTAFRIDRTRSGKSGGAETKPRLGGTVGGMTACPAFNPPRGIGWNPLGLSVVCIVFVIGQLFGFVAAHCHRTRAPSLSAPALL